MSIRTFLFICCAAVMVSTANAENPVKPETPETPNHPTHKLMDKRVSELMADRVGFKKDMALKELAEINEKAELEARENLMFPADELYGEWTNEWVNPFRGKKVDMPDSCVIDCSTFVLPMDSMTRVTSKYGPRRRRMHKGIDLKVQIGDTIRAAFDGKVRIKNFVTLIGVAAENPCIEGNRLLGWMNPSFLCRRKRNSLRWRFEACPRHFKTRKRNIFGESLIP